MTWSTARLRVYCFLLSGLWASHIPAARHVIRLVDLIEWIHIQSVELKHVCHYNIKTLKEVKQSCRWEQFVHHVFTVCWRGLCMSISQLNITSHPSHTVFAKEGMQTLLTANQSSSNTSIPHLYTVTAKSLFNIMFSSQWVFIICDRSFVSPRWLKWKLQDLNQSLIWWFKPDLKCPVCIRFFWCSLKKNLMFSKYLCHWSETHPAACKTHQVYTSQKETLTVILRK